MEIKFLRLLRWKVSALGVFFFVLLVSVALNDSAYAVNDYTNSAHGSFSYGVLRPSMNNASLGPDSYSQGNCAHCHEQHASFWNSDPDPPGGPWPYMIFTSNFNTSPTTGALYSETDNFCFYCHNDPASVQVVSNNDYSQVFGCSASGLVHNILDTFNQTSYHNLYNIWNFINTDSAFPWFTDDSNPCNACHNPHKARRNYDTPIDINFSAISKPSGHFTLWGTTATETMGGQYSTQYEPPYCSSGSTDREPAASADAATGRANTPDYVAFCTDCHNLTKTISSTPLGRDLIKIDWSAGGDKHGLKSMNGTISLQLPYNQGSIQNYVLSCLDCHEPHGSGNITLLRRRANGGGLVGTITTALPNPPGTGTNNNNREMGYICMRCHIQDAGTGTSTANPPTWKNVHHDVADNPYVSGGGMCSSCHGAAGTPPIACDKCHFHGATDVWLSTLGKTPTNRFTF